MSATDTKIEALNNLKHRLSAVIDETRATYQELNTAINDIDEIIPIQGENAHMVAVFRKTFDDALQRLEAVQSQLFMFVGNISC